MSRRLRFSKDRPTAAWWRFRKRGTPWIYVFTRGPRHIVLDICKSFYHGSRGFDCEEAPPGRPEEFLVVGQIEHSGQPHTFYYQNTMTLPDPKGGESKCTT